MTFDVERLWLTQIRRASQSSAGQVMPELLQWLETARRTGDAGLIAEGLAQYAECCRAIYRHTEALEAASQASVLAESSGDMKLLHKLLLMQATLVDDFGNPSEAFLLVERALELDCELLPAEIASTKGVCGSLLSRIGKPQQAVLALREAMDVRGLGPDDRLLRQMVLIWHLADDLALPMDAEQEWLRLCASHPPDRMPKPLRTPYFATAVAVWATNGRLEQLRVSHRMLLKEHERSPHVATGWATMLALEALAAAGLPGEAIALARASKSASKGLRKTDLHRWLSAWAIVARHQGLQQRSLRLQACAQRVKGKYLAPSATDARLLLAQLRGLEVRMNLVKSRAEAEGLRREILTREKQLRDINALPPSLLTELFLLSRRELDMSDEADMSKLGFSVVYQPFLCLKSLQIAGCEALLRLTHPQRGPLTPAEFIPQLDASREIEVVGRWVLQEACRQLQVWRTEGLLQSIAVNVTAGQLKAGGFAAFVDQILKRFRVEAERLELEITETVACSDSEAVTSELDHLRNAGVKISIDDFGTGYSNFGRLLDIIPHKVKIDRSLIIRLLSGLRPQRAVSSLIHAAHAMSMEVTAEGIETIEQAKLLHGFGCDHLQGYLFCRPCPADQLAQLLRHPREHWLDSLQLIPGRD